MPYPVLFSRKLIKPEHGWLLGVHRTQDSGHWSDKEFHTYDMATAGRQRPASDLVKMFKDHDELGIRELSSFGGTKEGS